MNKSSIKYLIAFAFFAMNFVFRFLQLDTNSLAGDEPYSVFISQLSISGILENLLPGNNPPLYELILHFWVNAFGVSEAAVRMPSLIFIALTAAVIFLIGNRFFSKNAGIVSAAVFTFANYATLFAHEARAYALFGLLTAFSFYFFLKWMSKQFTRADILLSGIVNALLLYTHYFGIIVLLMNGFLFLIIAFKRRDHVKTYLWSVGITALLFLPYIPVVFTRFMSTATSENWVQPPNGLLEVKYILSLFGNRLWLVLSVLVLSLLALVFMQARKKLSKQWLVVAFWFFVPFVAMYSFSFIMPMFIERYLMFVFIAFTILVGVITTLSSSLKTYALLLSATVVVLFAATSRANVDNGRHAKEAIAKAVELKEDGRLLIFPKFRTINNTYYLNRSMFINTADYPTSYQMVEAYKQDNIYIINQLSEARLDSTVNKVVLLMTDAGPFDQFKQGLSLDYEIESEEFFPAVYHLLVLKRKL